MASKNFDLPCQSDYRLQPFGHFIPQSPWIPTDAVMA